MSLLLSRLVSGGEQLTAVEVVSAATSLAKVKAQIVAYSLSLSAESMTKTTVQTAVEESLPAEWDAAVDRLASVAAARAADERGVSGRLGPCEIG